MNFPVHPINEKEMLDLAKLGREFFVWTKVNGPKMEHVGPDETQINDIARFGVRLISIIKSVS